jgi:RNA polymerase primary sigma factor
MNKQHKYTTEKAQITAIEQAKAYLQETLHRPATTEEIATETSITIETIKLLENYTIEPDYTDTPRGYKTFLKETHIIPRNSISINNATKIADTSMEEMIRASENNIFHEQINQIMDTFSPKVRSIIESRHGWINGQQKTLEEVGKEFGITRERIRQIEAKAYEAIKTALNNRETPQQKRERLAKDAYWKEQETKHAKHYYQLKKLEHIKKHTKC